MRSIDLVGDEFHHLSRVLRMNVGDGAYVTNGRGTIVRCRIEALERGAASLAVLGIEEDIPATRPVVLALALLKKDAFSRAVEQCTELGITRCVPFVSERSHVKRYSAEFIDRSRRVALSAMKQSFRAVLPEIEDPVGFDELVRRLVTAPLAIVGDAEGEVLTERLPAGPLTIVVGPEGGFAGVERDAMRTAGVRVVRASAHRLRSETAAASLVALALAASGGG